MSLTMFAQDERLRMQLARVLDLSGAALRAAAPVVDLLVRLALAKAFFAPEMFPAIGAGGFPAAWLMIIVQVIGPILMALGLLGRPVAADARAELAGAVLGRCAGRALVLGGTVWVVRRARTRITIPRPPAE
jgi:uncharacterized membrane protein YphA (DoxX/SURF4 family)